MPESSLTLHGVITKPNTATDPEPTQLWAWKDRVADTYGEDVIRDQEQTTRIDEVMAR